MQKQKHLLQPNAAGGACYSRRIALFSIGAVHRIDELHAACHILGDAGIAVVGGPQILQRFEPVKEQGNIVLVQLRQAMVHIAR